MSRPQSTARARLIARLFVGVLAAVMVLGVGGGVASIVTRHLYVATSPAAVTFAVTTPRNLPKVTSEQGAFMMSLRGKVIVQRLPKDETSPARTVVVDLRGTDDYVGPTIPAAGDPVSIAGPYIQGVATGTWVVHYSTVVGLIAPAGIALLAVLVLPALGMRRRGRALAWVAGAVFAVDQTTKAAGWRWVEGAVINAGGSAVMPTSGAMTALDNFYQNSLTGAFLDVCSAGLLVGGAWLLLRRPRSRVVMLGGALVWSGWASNWADRIGMTAATAPHVHRGVVDWIGHGWGRWNLADVAIASGTVLVLASIGVARAHLTRRTRLIGGALLVLVALLAAAGSQRVGPTDVLSCAPVAAQTVATPGLAGTAIASVTLALGGATCSGTTSTPAPVVVTASGADGVVLAAGQVDHLASVQVSGTNIWELPVDSVELFISDPALTPDTGTWVKITDTKWLLTSGDNAHALTADVTALLAPAGV
jgi:lipoprotein signal peptidase